MRVPNEALFLIAGTGVATTGRAMTLSFLAMKLQADFGLAPAMVGFLVGLGPLLSACAAPFVGALSDRVGRKLVLTSVMVAIAIAMMVLAVANTLVLFCAAQTLAAVGVAVFVPISRALISDICPRPLRLKCISWRHMASNIGWAVGPLIAVAAGVASDALFVAASAIYGAFAFITHFLNFSPPTLDEERSDVGDRSAASSVRAAMSDRQLLYFIAGSTLLVAVYGQWTATLAPYLLQSVQDGAAIFACLVSINGVVVVLANPLARRFVEAAGPSAAMVAGSASLIASQGGFYASTGMAGFVISMFVFTVGEILVMPAEFVFVDKVSTARNRGSYFGAHSSATIGGFLGPMSGGLILEELGGPAMFSLFAAFALIGALLYLGGARACRRR